MPVVGLVPTRGKDDGALLCTITQVRAVPECQGMSGRASVRATRQRAPPSDGRRGCACEHNFVKPIANDEDAAVQLSMTVAPSLMPTQWLSDFCPYAYPSTLILND